MPEASLWPGFLLVLARCFGFLQSSPFFLQRGQPALARVGLAIFFTLVLFPGLPAPPLLAATGEAGFGVQVAGELLVGLALGYLVTLFLTTLRVAGQLIDLQVGFAFVSLLSPEGGRGSVLGEFLYLLGLTVFLLLDGHHDLLLALADSFRIIPVGGAAFGAPVALAALRAFSGMFTLAVRIALPVVGTLLVLDVALGLVARTVPQLNVFMLAFPIKVGLGLLLLGLLAPVLGAVVGMVEAELRGGLAVLLGALKP